MTPDRRQWAGPADLALVDRVWAEMAAWLAGLELSSHAFALEILAREALNNAILHGSQCDPARQVRCQLEWDEAFIRLQVCDDGPGFDWRPKLRAELAAVYEEHGRGLALYRLYADEVEFNASGNCVRLARRRAR